MFAMLRREDSVHWQSEEAPNSGFWAVTKHADIVAVDRAPETFTSSRFVNLEEVDDSQIALRKSMLKLDGLRHNALRRLLQREFTPRAVAAPTASSCAS